MRPLLARSALCALVLAGLSCGKDKVVRTACRDDSACPSGYLCENFECIPAETKACDVVTEGNPILQPSPYSVAFGDLDAPDATQTVSLHNLGNCTLTLFEAGLGRKAESAFGCDVCQGSFPVEIFPGRSKQVAVSFKAPKVGAFDDALVVLSDDKEFAELRIPLHANFLGVPALKVTPNPVDFGYVAQGRVGKRQMQATNQGTGVAAVEVTAVKLVPEDTVDFELTAPALPVTLRPISGDTQAILAFELAYHPRSSAAHTAELVFSTSKGEVRVPVKGSSQTPPKLSVNPLSIDLGRVPLGQTTFAPLTLLNEGGAPLTVKYTWGGPRPSTDLFALPNQVPPIQPGKYVELQVGVTAATLGAVNGLLQLTSDDPARPSVTVPVTAEGVAGPGPEVVKLEMVFENGSDSAFDNDLRNVDLTLEHPFGYVVNKATPKSMGWGTYGNATWLAFGPKEEPERIILADATRDGTFRVMVQYMEDCSSLPTALLAGLLGISVDVLVDVLSGGAVDIGGKDLGELISKVCLSHERSDITVRAFVNGTVVMEKTVTLQKKGDTAYAFDLVRQGGAFTAK